MTNYEKIKNMSVEGMTNYLIDREEAIKVISNDSLDVKCFCVIGRGQENREFAKTINDYVDLLLETAKRKILSLPKADTERHAHWNNISFNSNAKRIDVCSCCRSAILRDVDSDKYNYCPNCGCKMDEVTQ